MDVKELEKYAIERTRYYAGLLHRDDQDLIVKIEYTVSPMDTGMSPRECLQHAFHSFGACTQECYGRKAVITFMRGFIEAAAMLPEDRAKLAVDSLACHEAAHLGQKEDWEDGHTELFYRIMHELFKGDDLHKVLTAEEYVHCSAMSTIILNERILKTKVEFELH